MTRWSRGFSFEREARWLMVILLVIPVIAVVVAIVIPGLWRLLGPTG